MSPQDPSADEAGVAPVEAKQKIMRLVGLRRPATKINRKFLVLALGGTGAILALFFGERLAGAAASSQTVKKDPAASAPVAPPPPVKPPSYGDAVIASADGVTTVSMPCSQYPGYANCTPDPPAGAATMGAAGAAGPGAAGGTQEAGRLAQRQQAAEDQAYNQAQAARSSAVFFAGSTGAGQAAGGSAPSGGPGFLPVAQPGSATAASVTSASDVLGGSGQGEKRAFAGQSETQDYISGRLQAPLSPYEVKAGTIIPAALVTAINSDLPGDIVAQVTEPVYDHVTGRFMLIPQGARLIGHYDSQISFGQNRALIAWNRIVFPNGYSINVGSMEGADVSGASGLADRVNHHWGTAAAGVAISSVLAIGSAVATDAASNNGGVTVINAGATTSTSDVSRVGDRIVDRALNRQPTIEVRAGFVLNVIVNKDIILEPYR